MISDSQTNKFTLQDNKQKKISKATKSNVTRAIEKWEAYGDQYKENLMIFYFCGHALAKGLYVSLLLEDFGKKIKRPLENAIDFDGFYRGMENCKAREQCFFIDACRNASTNLIEINSKGDAIFPERNIPSGYGKRQGPVYFSTVAGDTAYGRIKKPSLFTEALLRPLKGAGSDNVGGSWSIDDVGILNGMRYIISRLIPEKEGIEQICEGNHTTGFSIHFLKDKPIIPVSVGCKPKKANKMADLSCKNKTTNEMKKRVKKRLAEWDVDLKEGDYKFFARFHPENKYKNSAESQYIRPPFRPVVIKVTK